MVLLDVFFCLVPFPLVVVKLFDVHGRNAVCKNTANKNNTECTVLQLFLLVDSGMSQL